MAATDFEVTVNTKDFDQSIRRIIAEMKEVDKTSKDTGNSIDGMGKKIAGAAAAYFSVQQAQQFLNKVIEIRGQFQQLDIAFTTMLQGNKEASSKLMNELTEFASVTPFGLMDAASGAKQLLAYGFEVENVVKDMEMLGNVASGVSAPLNDIVYLYGTLKASGRVATMDIRQFAGRGIPIYRELAEVLGVAESEINDLVSAGKVGFNDIEKAFQRMTGQGGTFYNLMREQSKSLPGQISNLEDSIDMMFNEIGAASEGFISKGIEGAAWLVENYEKVGRTLLELVGAYGAYKVALVSVKALMSGMTAAELKHYAAIVAKEKAQKLLNKTMLNNPYVIAAAALAGLAYGMYKLITYQNEYQKQQEELNGSFSKAQTEAAKEVAELDRLRGKLEACEENTDTYKKTKEEIVSKFGKYDDTLKAETLSVQTLTDKYKSLSDAIVAAANKRMYNDWLTKSTEKYNTKETELLDEIYEGLIKEKGDKEGARLYQQFVSALYKGENPVNQRRGHYNKELAIALDDAWMLGEAKEVLELFETRQKMIKQAKQRFNITDEVPITTGGGEDGNENDTAKTINQLEEELKSKKEELGKLTEIEALGEKGVKIRQEIYDLENRIARAKGGGTTTSETKTNLSADYAREMAKQVADAQLEIRQASIDAMNEGFAKENAQLELNYHKQLQEITNMESEMVEKLRDYEQKKWEQANPKAKEQGKAFNRSSITADNLSPEQKAIVNTMYSQANAEYLTDSTELHKELLKEWQTYEEQRLAITEKYNKISADVIAAGGTQENLQEVNRAEDAELEALDEQFASRSADFEAWANTLTDMTVSTLIAQITEVNNLLQNSGAKGVDLAVLRQKQAMLKKEMDARKANAKAEKDSKPNNRTISEWKDVQDVIQGSIDVFEELGDAIGGTAGEILSAAGMIASSTLQMIDGIKQLSDSSVIAMKATAEGAAQAMTTVEKASVILTIISAAMQVAMKIAELFNQDDERQARIDELQREIDELEFQRNNPEIVKMWETRGKAFDNVNSILTEHIKLLKEEIKAQTGLNESFVDSIANMIGLGKGSEQYNKTIQKLVSSYADLSYADASLTTQEKYENAGKQLEYIAEQQLLIAEMTRQESEENKEPDKDKLQEYAEKQEELALEAAKVQADIIEEIIGGSARSIAEQLADAYWEAAEEGKNAMQSWGDEVNDIVKGIIKNMLVTQTLEPILANIIDKYTKEWFDEKGNFLGWDKVKSTLPTMAQEMAEAGNEWVNQVNNIPAELEEYLYSEAERQSSSRGIATASQESVDENNARLTTIQAHTASIAGNVEEMVKELHEQRLISLRCNQLVDDIRENTIAMIQHLQGIEVNTSKLDKIDKTLSDIALKGIKMK